MIRPLHDWVLVELEPPDEQEGLIQVLKEQAIRKAKVLSVGPGRRHSKTDVLSRTKVKPGERVCFHIATLQTKQGKAIVHALDDRLGLIKESDIFGVLEEDGRVSL